MTKPNFSEYYDFGGVRLYDADQVDAFIDEEMITGELIGSYVELYKQIKSIVGSYPENWGPDADWSIPMAQVRKAFEECKNGE